MTSRLAKITVGGVARVVDLLANAAGRERIVGTNGRPNSSLNAASATKTAFQTRAAFYVGADTDSVRLTFDNWAINGTGGDDVPPGALTLDKVTIESAALVAHTPLRFSGARSVAIPAGTTTVSDTLDASAFGLPRFTRGERYWVRVTGHVDATTGQIPVGRQFNPTGYRSSFFDPSTASDQTDATGAMTAQPGETFSGAGHSFTAVLGRPVGEAIPSLIGVGDSIADNTADDNTLVSTAGFLARASFDAAFGHPVPLLNLGRGSSTAAGFVGALTRKAFYFDYATALIDEYGTNDIQSTGLGDEGALRTSVAAIWAAARDRGVTTVIRTKLIPRATATSDSYASLAGQTVAAAFETKGQAFNDWLDTQVAGGALAAVVAMDSVRDPGNPWRWKTNGTANYMTADGTHPRPAGHALMGPELRATLEALCPGITS